MHTWAWLFIVLALPAWAEAQALPPLTKPAGLYEMNADGTGLKQLRTFENFERLGSLRMSPDGTRLSFDGCRPATGEAWSDASLLTCKPDGTDFRNLGRGAMPNFSPDGKQISFCSYSSGVTIADANGENRKLIGEDAWAVQWSPVGSEVAFVRNSRHLIVRNLETGVERSLFPAEGGPYSHIYFNLAWSPDGKRLALFAQREGGMNEVAVIDAQGAEHGFRALVPMKGTSQFIAWHPDGKTVAFQQWVGAGKSKIVTVDADSPGKPALIPGQPDDVRSRAVCWTPDGTKMLLIMDGFDIKPDSPAM